MKLSVQACFKGVCTRTFTVLVVSFGRVSGTTKRGHTAHGAVVPAEWMNRRDRQCFCLQYSPRINNRLATPSTSYKSRVRPQLPQEVHGVLWWSVVSSYGSIREYSVKSIQLLVPWGLVSTQSSHSSFRYPRVRQQYLGQTYLYIYTVLLLMFH